MKLQIPMQCRAAAVNSVNAEKRTVDLVWSTGAAVLRMDFWTGRKWMEELSLEPDHVRMGRMTGGAPLLDAHNSYGLRGQIGVVESASVDGKKGIATVRFSERADVEPIWQDVKDKIIRNVSVGYNVYRFKTVSKEDADIKVLRAVDWEPAEISLVPVGADAGAGIRAASLQTDCEIEEFSEVGAASQEKRGYDIGVLLAINTSRTRRMR